MFMAGGADRHQATPTEGVPDTNSRETDVVKSSSNIGGVVPRLIGPWRPIGSAVAPKVQIPTSIPIAERVDKPIHRTCALPSP